MNFKEQQEKFDKIKWHDGIVMGGDMCGTYDFCSVCDKSLQYPCARAAYKYKRGSVRVATVRLKIGD